MHRNTFREKRWGYLTPEDFQEAEKNGISYQTAHRRVYSYGWEINRAITQPPQVKKKRFNGWKDWKEKALVSKGTFVNRVNLGWSERRAAMTPPMTKSEAAKKRRKYSEEIYKKAAENGVSEWLFRYRVTQMGWDAKKAYSTPPMSRSESGKMAMKKRWG